MKKLRIGFVGLGQRGSSMCNTFLAFDNVDITAICDKYEDRVNATKDLIKEKRAVEPNCYLKFEDFINERKFDAVYIATDWEEHINQAIVCLQNHIPVGMEVGGAYDINDCWRLVDAYEKTKTPFMLMENCMYDKFETLLFNLNKAGKFGDIVHCHGGYSHDIRDEISNGYVNRHYRLRNYLSRNCENYPTHELGPIAKLLNINRGNRFVSLVSVSSSSKGLKQFINDGKSKDPSLKDKEFAQGDVVSTIIKCENGETITLTLDTTLPGYYSRQLWVKGTKGSANQEANMVLFDDNHDNIWHTNETIKKYLNNADELKDYQDDNWKNITPEQINLGHGGMDYFMVKDFIDCVINNKPLPITVYDAAAWYAITPLSEKSIKENGAPQEIPDFTRGKYKLDL